MIRTPTPHAARSGFAAAASLVFLGVSPSLACAQSKSPQQTVKPPMAMAYMDLATSTSEIPGGNLMGAAAQGGSSGGLLGALGGMARSAAGGATGGGNTFGQTRSMGFASGKFVDVSVYTNRNRTLTDALQTIPAGMALGDSLKLLAPVPERNTPAPVEPVEPVDEKPYEPSYEKPRGKISMYWGCGETIRPGQPRTLDAATARMEDFGRFFVTRGSTTKGARSEPGHPAWPNNQDDRQVPANASLVGQHGFSGIGIPDSFKVTLGAAQDLMAPLQLTQTKNDTGFVLDWQPVPHARGYFVAAMGGKSDGGESGEAVFWTSSELPDTGFGLLDYQSNSSLDKWIGEKVVLPASATRCAVPKGIFLESGGGMLRMIAYGSEAFFAYPPRPQDPKVAWEPQWQTKVRLKSTFFSTLGSAGGDARRRSDMPSGNANEPEREKREESKPSPVNILKGLFGL